MNLIIVLFFILGQPYGKTSNSAEGAKVVCAFDTAYFSNAQYLIENSKKEIVVCMFQFSYYNDKPESYSNRLAELLLKKAEQGVKVRLLLEGGEDFLGKGFTNSVKSILSKLNHKNIEIKLDLKNRTTHAKFMVVDSRFVLIGSTNWTYYGLQENNESNVLIESEQIAKEFKKYFEKLWSESKKENPSFYDSSNSIFVGTAKIVERKVSKKGKPYTIIYLNDGTRVFIRGHYDYVSGMKLKIEGRLNSFRGKKQIEAYRIEVLK